MDQNKSNRQKMNKLIMTGVLAVLLALTGTVPAVAQDNVIDEVVWVVGDEAILKSDVENERLNAQYEGRRQPTPLHQ
jgi:peptidyl-prolyl cis-trans isomerase SurA